MLPEDLVELANTIMQKKAESQYIEVKSAHEGCPKKLYDTLSSFSNQDRGGILIFGLDERQNFEPIGVYDLQDLQKKVTEQCKQMEPPVRATFTFAEINGYDICSAEIPGLDLSERPCYYQGIGRVKGSYIRVGDADLHMTDYELYSFEAFRKHQHDDERPVERAAASALDTASLEKYVLEKKVDRPQFSLLSSDMIYEMLNIFRNGVPTLAALMNFGIYPQGYFPQLGITAIVVPGIEIGETDRYDARFLDNKRIEGNIASMVTEGLAFCQRNMKTKTVIDTKTGKRTDQTEYPVKAIREAILNAVIHRDYSIYTEGTPIQLNIFSNRIEVHSPGTLYGRMTVEQLGISKPDLRNPALAVMAESLTEAENRYSGIPTMRREMAAWGLPAPVFENRRNEFVVTFFNTPQTPNEPIDIPSAVEAENPLLEFCKIPRTRAEIAAFLGLKTTFYAMTKYILPLLDAGLLKMTLPDKPRSRNQKYYSDSI